MREKWRTGRSLVAPDLTGDLQAAEGEGHRHGGHRVAGGLGPPADLLEDGDRKAGREGWRLRVGHRGARTRGELAAHVDRLAAIPVVARVGDEGAESDAVLLPEAVPDAVAVGEALIGGGLFRPVVPELESLHPRSDGVEGHPDVDPDLSVLGRDRFQHVDDVVGEASGGVA